jgi:hypothetical protein
MKTTKLGMDRTLLSAPGLLPLFGSTAFLPCSALAVITDILAHQPVEMPFIPYNHSTQQVASTVAEPHLRLKETLTHPSDISSTLITGSIAFAMHTPRAHEAGPHSHRRLDRVSHLYRFQSRISFKCCMAFCDTY